MNNIDRISGQGLMFPLEVENGTVKPKSGLQLIVSCLHNILAFEPGGKFFQRDFGVPLRRLISEPNDRYVEALLDYKLMTQLPKWDKRVSVDKVEVTRDGAKLTARVTVLLTYTNPTSTLEVDFPLDSLRT